MSPFLFWTFSGLMLLFGLLVVVLRHPVGNALSLVVSFLALAGLYVTLDAFFIGVTQVLVYAGAVMVLFLFIIMLLDLKAEQMRKIQPLAMFTGGAVVLAFAVLIRAVINSFSEGKAPLPVLTKAEHSDVWQVGYTLFSSFNLPFQVIGVLILVATIGVVVLSQRELK